MTTKTKYLKYLFLLHWIFLTPFSSFAAADQDGLRKLVIFQTSDIHSHIQPSDGGWLSLAQMIKRRRSACGGIDKTLLIDCGDTVPGTIIGAQSRGKAAVALMNAMHYDAWILGNHDFEFGIKTLLELGRDSNLPFFAANLKLDNVFSDENHDLPRPISWKLYTKNGIRIALIGLTSPHLSEWLWGTKAAGYSLEDTFHSLDQIMPEVLNVKSDMIILAIHHGRFSPKRLHSYTVAKIAENYPQIDLILGGHSHQEVPGEKFGASTWYVESGCHAHKFAEIAVYVDKKNRCVHSITSKLVPVEKQKHISEEFRKAVLPWNEKAAKFAKKSLGYTENVINGVQQNSFSSSMSEIICLAIAEKSGAEFVFHGVVVPSVAFSGNITEQDVFNALPYEDTICTLKLLPSQIKAVLQEQIDEKGFNRFQSIYGFTAELKNGKITALKDSKGDILKSGHRYKCTFSSYVLAGAGGRFPLLKMIAAQSSVSPVDMGITIRDSLREYIAKHSPLKIKPVNRIRTLRTSQNNR